MRFDGVLYFANVPYFEDVILEAVANNSTAKHLLSLATVVFRQPGFKLGCIHRPADEIALSLFTKIAA